MYLTRYLKRFYVSPLLMDSKHFWYRYSIIFKIVHHHIQAILCLSLYFPFSFQLYPSILFHITVHFSFPTHYSCPSHTHSIIQVLCQASDLLPRHPLSARMRMLKSENRWIVNLPTSLPAYSGYQLPDNV